MRRALAASLVSAALSLSLAGALPAPAAGQAVLGSFEVREGPWWETSPPIYDCLEACAVVFGGAAADYACSTLGDSIDHQAYVSGWGDETYCTTPVAEDYSVGVLYDDCGSVGCSYSAYVNDHCDEGLARNYCWLPDCGDGDLDGGEECDDGNLADGDCCSAACQLEATLGSCDDSDPCTQDSCGTAGCLNDAAPAPVCDEDAGKASLLLDAAKHKASFAWQKGTVAFADLGTPTDAADYALCLYSYDGALARLDVPAGGTCSGRDCWRQTGKPATPTGFVYKDRLAASDGVRSLALKAHDAGRAKLSLAARGGAVPALDLGTAGLAAPVTAQLVHEGGACWGASFEAADTKKSDASVFKAQRSAAP
jgi:cysteine-rich repeat protein